jgi:hypothetical protein
MYSRENNNVSRLQNRMLHSLNEPLAPLYDMQNVIVNGFPQTSGEIDQLGGAYISDINL